VFGDDRIDHRAVYLGIPHIELNGLGRRAVRAKFGDKGLEAIQAACAQNDVMVVGGKPQGCGRSDTLLAPVMSTVLRCCCVFMLFSLVSKRRTPTAAMRLGVEHPPRAMRTDLGLLNDQ
jgi:hypothetical protein